MGLYHHAPFFTIPLCQPHHQAVTIAINRAGVDPHYTNDAAARARRARMAAYVFLWFVDDQLQPKQEIKDEKNNKQSNEVSGRLASEQ